MTPRWIAEALNAVNESNRGPGIGVDVDYEAVAAALIERLPIDAMTGAIRKRIAGTDGITGDWLGAIAGLATAGAADALADDDPEVVTFTELYQGACKALDDAGVPYAVLPGGVHCQLDLAARIRWLAQQRPTRLDQQRAEAERDVARTELAKSVYERDASARIAAASEAASADTIADLGAQISHLKTQLGAERSALRQLGEARDMYRTERDVWHRRYDECIVTITANQQSIATLIDGSETRRREHEAVYAELNRTRQLLHEAKQEIDDSDSAAETAQIARDVARRELADLRMTLEEAERHRDIARGQADVRGEELVRAGTDGAIERATLRDQLAEMTRDRDYWQALAEVRAAALLP